MPRYLPDRVKRRVNRQRGGPALRSCSENQWRTEMNSVREVAAGRVRRIVPFKTPRGFQRSTPLLRKTLPRDGHTPSPKATKQNRRQFFVAAGGGGRFLQQGAGGQGQCQLGRVRRHRPPRVSQQPPPRHTTARGTATCRRTTADGRSALRSCTRTRTENQWRTEIASVREVRLVERAWCAA